jgi:hypothetical protein
MVECLPHRQITRTRQEGAHERTEADEGLGVARGVPAVHDGCPGSFPFEACASSKGSVARFVQKIIALSSDRT